MSDKSSPKLEEWSRFTHFVGVDWGTAFHRMVAVDRDGRVVDELEFDDDAEGWSCFRDRVAGLPRPAVTLETSCGPVVERLLEMGAAVFPVNPAAAKAFRSRKAPAGVKDDRLDAWSQADALRTDGHAWRRLVPDEPLTQELRLLCRDEIALIERRTALVNALRAALREYFPAFLKAFEDMTLVSAWSFLERFPTPRALAEAGRRRQQGALHALGLGHPATMERRLEIFAKAAEFAGPEPVTRAKSMLAVATCRELQTLERQLKEYRARIEALFPDHPDSGIFRSLPGAGPKLAPRLLTQCGDDRGRYDSPEAMQRCAGAAPVTIQSGRMRRVRQRMACDKQFRCAVHLWANLSRPSCAWAEAYYQRKRSEGKSHACALRCLAQRWLKILWTMWTERRPYDEARHTRDQARGPEWRLTLNSPATPATPAPI